MNVSEVTRWGGALPQLNPETNFTIEQIARNVGQSEYKIRNLMERHGMQPDGKIGHSHAVTPGNAMLIKALAKTSKQARAARKLVEEIKERLALLERVLDA
jgi:hypothetical protein